MSERFAERGMIGAGTGSFGSTAATVHAIETSADCECIQSPWINFINAYEQLLHKKMVWRSKCISPTILCPILQLHLTRSSTKLLRCTFCNIIINQSTGAKAVHRFLMKLTPFLSFLIQNGILITPSLESFFLTSLIASCI